MKIYAYTEAGRGRKNNEDRYLIKRNGKAAVLVAVADGLGGEVAGEYASEVIRERLSRSAGDFTGDEHQLSDIIKKPTGFYGRGQKRMILSGGWVLP